MTSKIIADGSKAMGEKGRSFPLPQSEHANPQSTTRAYFDAIQLELRVIDSVAADCRMDLFGRTFRTPIMTAALSSLSTLFTDGTAAMARGAHAAGAVVWTGIGDNDELKTIVDTGAATVKLVKPYADEDLIFAKLEQAEEAGVLAVGMDIDFVFGGKAKAPPAPMAPKTLSQIQSYVKATKLPFILKGILSEQDAEKALQAGAGGIVVSHHGGALLDYTLPPLRILPRIKKLVAGRIPVFVDCGICRGLDAFKAMALGANAVSVGKALMAGLSAGGADGVRQVIEEMTAELTRAMSLTGAARLADVDDSVLWLPERHV